MELKCKHRSLFTLPNAFKPNIISMILIICMIAQCSLAIHIDIAKAFAQRHHSILRQSQGEDAEVEMKTVVLTMLDGEAFKWIAAPEFTAFWAIFSLLYGTMCGFFFFMSYQWTKDILGAIDS